MSAVLVRTAGPRQLDSRCGASRSAALADKVQYLHLRPKQTSKPRRPSRHRDEKTSAGVAEDATLPAQVILKLRDPHGRVDRHGNSARIEYSKEGGEKFNARRQDQRNAVAWHYLPRDQPARQGAGFGSKLGIGEPSNRSRLILQHG